MNQKARGFTIVELLIVIVVIGILAAISIVAYNTVSAKARDSQRQSDVAALTKALELYYIDNGRYPRVAGSWAYSDDASWETLLAELEPYATGLPTSDPTNQRDGSAPQISRIYAYFSNANGSASTPDYCGVTSQAQMFILTYNFEASSRRTQPVGECTEPQLSYLRSWYRSVKR